MSKVGNKLAELGVELPKVSAPVAAYVPFVVSDGMAFISGALPLKDGKLLATGLVGKDCSIEEAESAAKQCAVNAIASLKSAAGGDLDRVERIIKIEGFVASSSDFVEQHLVMNAASEFILDAFGEIGKHARIAVGVASLPLGAAVEVAMVAKVAKA